MTVTEFTQLATEHGWEVIDTSSPDEVYLELTKGKILEEPFRVFVRIASERFSAFQVGEILMRTFLQFDCSERIMPCFRVGGYTLVKELCEGVLEAFKVLGELIHAVDHYSGESHDTTLLREDPDTFIHRELLGIN